jgi:opacity protein-like surface antigen
MKNLLLLTAFICYSGILNAQSINAPVYDNEGFFVGGSILGSAWNFDVGGIDSEAGVGLGVKLGYNYNPFIGLFASFDAASIAPESGDNYLLGHFDMGIQGFLRSTTERIRPFGRASVVGMSAQDDDAEVNGAGFGLGAGLLISLTDKLGFDVNYTHSWINVTEVRIGSDSFDVDEIVSSGRFFIGLVYHF